MYDHTRASLNSFFVLISICKSIGFSNFCLLGKIIPIQGTVITEAPLAESTSYPGSFYYAPRWRKDPGPGWSRVSHILGDNNWD